MAEYIDRQAALEILTQYDRAHIKQKGKPILGIACMVVDIEDIPAADVRPVVFCKDCKWYQIDELKKDGTEDRRYKPSVCVLAEQRRDPNHFCADGEKREES